jgi:hypothetical protein
MERLAACLGFASFERGYGYMTPIERQGYGHFP